MSSLMHTLPMAGMAALALALVPVVAISPILLYIPQTMLMMRRQTDIVAIMALALCMNAMSTDLTHAQTTSAVSRPQWYPMVRPNLDSHSIVFDRIMMIIGRYNIQISRVG